MVEQGLKRKWKGQQAAWNEEELGKRLRGVSKSLARENAEKGSLEEEEKDRLEKGKVERFEREGMSCRGREDRKNQQKNEGQEKA